MYIHCDEAESTTPCFILQSKRIAASELLKDLFIILAEMFHALVQEGGHRPDAITHRATVLADTDTNLAAKRPRFLRYGRVGKRWHGVVINDVVDNFPIL